MKYNPYFRDPIPLITIPRAYKNLYIRSAAPTSIEETPNEVVEEPVVSDVEEIRHTPPKGRIIFKNDLDPGNLQPLLQKFWENGINVRVTSGKQNRKTSSGKTSWHTSGDAIDITPIAGETYSDLKNKLSKNPELLQWMRDNGYGILDETTPSMQQRTGATAGHWHIGKDRIALDNFKAWFGKQGGNVPKFQRGKLFPDAKDFHKPDQRQSEDTYINGYGVQRSLREGRQEGRRVRTSRAARNIGEALSVGALGASAIAAAPAIPTILSNPWVGTGLTSYFGAHGIRRAPKTIQQTREAFQEGSTRDKVEAVSNAILNAAEVAPLVRPVRAAAHSISRLPSRIKPKASISNETVSEYISNDEMETLYKAGRQDAIDFLEHPIVQNAQLRNIEVAKRIGKKSHTLYGVEGSDPIRGYPTTEGISRIKDNRKVDFYGDPYSGIEGTWHPAENLIRMNRWNTRSGFRRGAAHENRHVARYGDSEFSQWKAERVLKSPGEVEKAMLDRKLNPDYIYQSGELTNNLLDAAKQLGIGIGQVFPGNTEAAKIFMNWPSDKLYIFDVLKVSKNGDLRRIWNIMNGTAKLENSEIQNTKQSWQV